MIKKKKKKGSKQVLLVSVKTPCEVGNDNQGLTASLAAFFVYLFILTLLLWFGTTALNGSPIPKQNE